MRDHDQPPVGAVRLSEALNPELVEAARRARERLAAAQAAVPPRPSWFDGAPLEAVEAWEHSPAVRAEAAAEDEVNRAWRAAVNDCQSRLINGERLAWGREASPWGPWRAIEPHAWGILIIGDLEQGIVRVAGRSEVRLYSVVVANKETALTQAAVPTAPDAPASTAAAETRWLIEEMASGACKEFKHSQRYPIGATRAYERGNNDDPAIPIEALPAGEGEGMVSTTGGTL